MLVVATAVLLGGCEQLGIETAESAAAARQADGRAVGAACRHAGRAIEDCYRLYAKVDRSAVFAGWRDMNDYMREHSIEGVAPKMATQPAGDDEADDAETAAAAPTPVRKVARASGR
jgi:hypothetical protein